MRLKLSARVSSDAPAAVLPVLKAHLPGAGVRRDGADFIVTAALDGPDAKTVNRDLLSALRRAEKRTRLRAEWTGPDGTTWRCFDYVLKKTLPAE